MFPIIFVQILFQEMSLHDFNHFIKRLIILNKISKMNMKLFQHSGEYNFIEH